MKKHNNKQEYINKFNQLTTNEQCILINWIKNNLPKRKTINTNATSYGLKHYFEKYKDGFYITNDQFKGAMSLCDYNIKNENALNWCFNISLKLIK